MLRTLLAALCGFAALSNADVATAWEAQGAPYEVYSLEFVPTQNAPAGAAGNGTDHRIDLVGRHGDLVRLPIEGGE